MPYHLVLHHAICHAVPPNHLSWQSGTPAPWALQFLQAGVGFLLFRPFSTSPESWGYLLGQGQGYSQISVGVPDCGIQE